MSVTTTSAAPLGPAQLSYISSASLASQSAAALNPPLGATDAITGLPFGWNPNATAIQRLRATGTGALSVKPSRVCGPAAEFYNPTSDDWKAHDIDHWLETWILAHQAEIVKHRYGFSGAFGEWATGSPDYSCRDDGSAANCNFSPCSITNLTVAPNEIRQAYYIMESITRLHGYFNGLRESFTTASIGAALAKDGFAATFYVDKDVQNVQLARQGLTAVTTTFGLLACAAGFGPLGFAVYSAAALTLFSGAVSTVGPLLGTHADNTYVTAGNLGIEMAKLVVQSIQSFTTANNALVGGHNYIGTGDIRAYIANGSFVSFPGIDKNLVTNQVSNFLTGQAINTLWRQQKVFIMGGGACGDGQGIGSGPQDNMVCRDGKAWYLYWWQEPDRFYGTKKHFGWVSAPPGSDQLSKGMYAGISVQDAINSSLDSYIAAGYNYTTTTSIARAKTGISKAIVNPLRQGPSAEGVFSIPVCDVGKQIGKVGSWRKYILQPYGGDNRPMWCDAICDNNHQLTLDFIKAANMEGFSSPVFQCSGPIVRNQVNKVGQNYGG